EGDGGIRSWELATGRERTRIPAHRSMVEGLAVSADGRYLLQITRTGRALVWDLKEGRGARTLPGRWAAGCFLPDADNARLARVRAANRGGAVVLGERAGGRVQATLERPRARAGTDMSRVAFRRVTVSGDGKALAAAAAAGRRELVCVWNLAAGGAPRVIQ